MTAQQITNACIANWFANRSDCSAFVRAVTTDLGLNIFSPADNADTIMDKLGNNSSWSNIGDLGTVQQDAAAGMLIIAGLKGAEFIPARAHGHVVIVVQGDDAAHPGFPLAYWGMLGGVGQQNSSIRNAFIPNKDLDNVQYFGYTFAPSLIGDLVYRGQPTGAGGLAQISAAVEGLMTKIAGLSGKTVEAIGSDSPERVFLNAIELIEIDVKVGTVEISLKIQGTKAT